MNATPEISSTNLALTAILDFEHPEVRGFAQQLGEFPSARVFLQAAHQAIAQQVRPVYNVDEWQPASTTFAKRRGSCSQRMALLEAVARARGIPTRVRALEVRGSFWYPRFRWLRPLLPGRVLLVWPQFFVEEQWLGVEELYAPVTELAAQGACRFSNEGETLFEAVQHSPVDFFGRCHSTAPGMDLSAFVVRDLGVFDSRDLVFREHGSLGSTLRGRIFNALYARRAPA